MASDAVLLALAMRRLEQRIAALERLEHGSGGGGGGLDFDDIDGLTPASITLSDSDTFAVYSAVDFGARKVSAHDILTSMITLPTETEPLTGDYFLLYDDFAARAVKVPYDLIFKIMESLPGGNLVPNDVVLYYDSTTNEPKVASVYGLLYPTGALDTGVPVAADDTIMFFDVANDYVRRTSFADLLAALTDVDGTGSGLDADLLDGNEATAFATATHAHSATDITSGTLDDARIPSGIARDSEVAAAYAALGHTHTTANITDYVVNTWTPVLAFGGGSTGITYTIQAASYVQIGKLVAAWVTILLSSKGSSTGQATITGFPFTLANGSAYDSTSVPLMSGATLTGDIIPQLSIANNTSTITGYVIDSGTLANMTNAHFGNTTLLQCHFVARVA